MSEAKDIPEFKNTLDAESFGCTMSKEDFWTVFKRRQFHLERSREATDANKRLAHSFQAQFDREACEAFAANPANKKPTPEEVSRETHSIYE